MFLNGALFVVLGADDFLAAHGTNAFLVGALLAVMSVCLVNSGPANLALSELVGQGVEAVLLGREEFIFADFSSSALSSVSGSGFPRILGNDL